MQASCARRRTRTAPMRVLLVVLVFAFAGLLAVDLQSSSAPRAAVAVPTRALANVVRPPRTVEVAFVKKGWIVRVDRVVPKGMTPQEFALRELTQGPTEVEQIGRASCRERVEIWGAG